MPVYSIAFTCEREIAVEADCEGQALDIAEGLIKPMPTPASCVYYRETCSFPFDDFVVEQHLQCPHCSSNFKVRLEGTIRGCFIRCRSCHRELRWERLAKNRDCSLCSKNLDCLTMASVIE